MAQFEAAEGSVGNPTGDAQGTVRKGGALGRRCILGVVDLEAGGGRKAEQSWRGEALSHRPRRGETHEYKSTKHQAYQTPGVGLGG